MMNVLPYFKLTWQIFLVVIRRSDPKRSLGVDGMKARIGSLKSEASIATFLAAVQAQTLAFSVQSNSTRLQTATNAFAFTGVLLDVVGAFLALLSSTLAQADLDRVTVLFDTVSGYNRDQLAELRFHEFHGPPSTQIHFELIRETMARYDDLSRVVEPNVRKEDTQDWKHVLPRVHPADLFHEADKISNRLYVFSIVGNAAGTATLFGTLCFLISVVCLATLTQPTAVWIPAVTACSCIVLLPAMNGLLAVFHLRVPNIFEM